MDKEERQGVSGARGGGVEAYYSAMDLIVERKTKSPGKKAVRMLSQMIRTKVPEKRIRGKVIYPLSQVLVMVFFAVCKGKTNVSSIWRWLANGKTQKHLREYIPDLVGVPCEDTFMRVLSVVDVGKLHEALVDFLMCVFSNVRKGKKGKRTQYCVDGKVNRGSGRLAGTASETKPLQILHVFEAYSGICLAGIPIDKKTNEIPVAQAVLRTLDLRDIIVSFDALHTQKETIGVIAGGGGYYVGGLKNNQKTLAEEASVCFDEEYLASLAKGTDNRCEYTEFANNNFIRREYYAYPYRHGKDDAFSDWPSVRTIICSRKTITKLKPRKGEQEKTTETKYYISNMTDVGMCATAIRNHWSVESMHNMLDTMFLDDANQTVNRTASANISLFKKMALGVFSQIKSALPQGGKKRLVAIREDFNDDFWDSMDMMLSLLDAKSIREALRT
jgi:predicted transposase YbfD/YdcC